MYTEASARAPTKIVSTRTVTLSMQAAFEAKCQENASFGEAFAAAIAAAPLVHGVPASIWLAIDEGNGQLPPDNTEVLLLVNGKMYEGLLQWDHPGYEDTYTSYRYFTDIDGRSDWDWPEVTHWAPKPAVPEGCVRCDVEPFVREMPESSLAVSEFCA
jgi:hypothetical protein